MEAPDLRDPLLREICERGGNLEGAVVGAGRLAGELGIAPRLLFAAVVMLVEEGHLEYLGAGPVVRLTALGLQRCEHLRRNPPIPPRPPGG